ncbi:MAG: serine/threonine protein kinase [Deltaproteobacteria bacterium]|nr:serine/threonine protein kinase [Deltaproteobacteria bacterium]
MTMRFCTTCLAMTAREAETCDRPGCRGALRPEALLGSVLDGRFRIDSVIALGGMGVLLRGRHLRLESPVAIKVLQLAGLDGAMAAEVLKRFRQEATLIARLRHPGIVAVLDYGAAPDGRPYIAMEFLEGRDLEGELREHGLLSPPRLAHVVSTVAGVLDWTHAHGVIHRDIKPANVMVARLGGEEAIKVLDFGVARLVEAATGTPAERTMIVGTAEYMAPEQIDGQASAIGPATDVYALAVTTYQLAAGETPFRARDFAGVVGRKMTMRFPGLAERRPEAGWAAVDVVLRRALAVSPADRTASATAFARELVQALAGVAAPRASEPPSAPAGGAVRSPGGARAGGRTVIDTGRRARGGLPGRGRT